MHATPLWVCDVAISKSHDTTRYDGEKMRKRIERVGRKMKHESVLEHLVYSFNIDGISRACLQELARHRMASLTVKSTRYTLNKIEYRPLINEEMGDVDWASMYEGELVKTGNEQIDCINALQLDMIIDYLSSEKSSNDIVKYAIPEALKTSLVWTINARSLQNFFDLRSSKEALWEIRDLAHYVYEALPEEHQFLFSLHPVE